MDNNVTVVATTVSISKLYARKNSGKEGVHMKKRSLMSLPKGIGYSTAVFFDLAKSREKYVQKRI